jgi:succinoglycan biosynthesis transport protein ExoP
MTTEYELTPFDYLSIARRRAPYLIGAFVVVLLVSIIVAVAIPPTYLASGTIMVESQQVPDNIVPAAGYDARQHVAYCQ